MIFREPRSILFALTCIAIMASSLENAVARGLAAAPPQGIDLSGDWQFNAALSDDVDSIMAERRAKLRERFAQERLRHERNTSRDEDDFYNPPPFAPDQDFAQLFAVPVRMTISQAGNRFLVKNAAANGDVNTEQYEAGGKSVVSFGAGYADRITGWLGKAFVVSLRAAGQNERKEQRYSLDSKGRLVMVTAFSGGGLPKVEIKSVYEPASNLP